MILAVAATEFEMRPMLKTLGSAPCHSLVCGVGPIESCLRLTSYLEKNRDTITKIIHFGVAGAYILPAGKQPQILDICIAETEIVGDFGICYPRRIDSLGEKICANTLFDLNKELVTTAQKVLRQYDIDCFSGNFITVNCVSGTRVRGELLRQKYDGLCENMEGAAIARVCDEYSLPLLEIRCVSNFVEDRDPQKWSLPQACDKSGRIAALVLKELQENDETI